MIATIRNPWVRRSLALVILPIWFAIVALLGLVATVIDVWDIVRVDFGAAWKGPRQ